MDEQTARYNVTGNVVHESLAGVSVGAQTNERIRDRDAKLHREHPGRLVHHNPQVVGRVELGRQRSWTSSSLESQDLVGDHVGHDQRVGQLGLVQDPRTIDVDVERTQSDRADLKGEAEDRLDTRRHRRGCERWPSRSDGIGQRGLEHWQAEAVGIETRSFPECELQFLDDTHGGIRAPEGPAMTPVDHDHDPRAGHREHTHARADQTGTRTLAGFTIVREAVQNLQGLFLAQDSNLPRDTRVRPERSVDERRDALLERNQLHETGDVGDRRSHR